MGFYGLLFTGVFIGIVSYVLAILINKHTNIHIPVWLPSLLIGILIIATGWMIGRWTGMAVSILGVGSVIATIIPISGKIISKLQNH